MSLSLVRFTVQVRSDEHAVDAIVVTPSSSIDTVDKGEVLSSVLAGLAHKPACIVVNLSECYMVDSYGFAVLWQTRTNLQNQKGEIKLASVPESLEKAFALMNPMSFTDFYPSLFKALESCNRKPISSSDQ